MNSTKALKRLVKESLKSVLIKEGYIEDMFPDHTMWDKFTGVLGDNLMSTLIFDYIKENDLMDDLFNFLGNKCEEMGYENPVAAQEDKDEEAYDEDVKVDEDGIPMRF